MAKLEIGSLMELMKEREATDLHISAGTPSYIRVNGNLLSLDKRCITPEESKDLIYSILTPEQIKIFEERKELDLAYGIEGKGRYRINVYKQRGTIAIAIRCVPWIIPTFDELGLPKKLMYELCSYTKGLILISGPTGSGKSTTQAAMIDYINRTRSCHIISLEDPIEYLHRNVNSVVHQRELGTDTLSFSEGLKHVLREDPDVVLVGEMRDLETMETALLVAETGHLVLTTLHTGSATEGISRIVNVFPPSQQQQIKTQLSLVLIGMIAQNLIPQIDNSGRVLALEIMIATSGIRNIIREGKLEQIYSQIQLGGKLGMKTMNRSLAEFYKKEKISIEEAMTRTGNHKELRRAVDELEKLGV